MVINRSFEIYLTLTGSWISFNLEIDSLNFKKLLNGKLLLIISLVFVSFLDVNGQFQRMRLSKGEFSISNIPVKCIDSHLPKPTYSDEFVKSTDNIFVKRVLNGKETIRPFSQASKEWIKLVGDYSTDVLKGKPINQNDPAEYFIQVIDDSGIVGGINHNLNVNLPNESIIGEFFPLVNDLPFDDNIKSGLQQQIIWLDRRGFTADYIGQYISDYSKMGDSYRLLLSSFGKDSPIVKNCISSGVDPDLFGTDVVPYSVNSLINSDPSKLSNLMSLHYGKRFNSEQLRALEITTNRKFDALTSEYDDAILISEYDEVITVSSKDLKKTYYSSDFDEIKNDFTLVKSRVYINSYSIDDNLVRWLNSNDIKVVYDINKLSNAKTSIGKVRPIIISSENKDLVKQLYETTEDIEEIIELTRESKKIKNSIVVDNEEDLREVLFNLEKDEIPLYIFNNGSEGVMFKNPIDPNTFDFSISCNSYEYDGFYKSTDFVDIKCVFKAIADNQVKYGSNSIAMDKYMYAFQDVYTECIKRKNVKIVAGVLIAGGTVSGGITYGYYELNKK